MKILRKISILIIILGILVFLIPVVGQITTNYLENKMISDWKNGTVESNSSFYSNLSNAYNKVVDTFSVEKSAEQNLTQDLTNIPDTTDKTTEVTPKSSKTLNVKASKPVKKKVKVKQKVIGIIEISKIKVKLPIVEGVLKENLRVGVGHIPGTAELGAVGNAALAGHRSYALGHFFNRLDEVVVGDEIKIITKKGNFVYKVYEKLVVFISSIAS